MPNENLVSIVATRDNMAQDLGGGFVAGTPKAVYSGPAKLFPAMLGSSNDRDESDPGIQTTSIRYVRIDRPITFGTGITEFLPTDRLAVGSANYTVKGVWEYSRSVQLEVWELH